MEVKKSYKSRLPEFIGASDIASLTVRAGEFIGALDFGEDGSYSAYIVEDAANAIPNYYACIFEGVANWLTIYDDNGKSFSKSFDNLKNIKIYRAGDFGCVIQILDL